MISITAPVKIIGYVIHRLINSSQLHDEDTVSNSIYQLKGSANHKLHNVWNYMFWELTTVFLSWTAWCTGSSITGWSKNWFI